MTIHTARRAAYSAKINARAAGATKQEAVEAAKAAWDATVSGGECADTKGGEHGGDD